MDFFGNLAGHSGTRHKLAECVAPNPSGKRRSELQTAIDNLAETMASGLLRSSPALAERLPRVLDAFRAKVAKLGELAQSDVVRARTEIHQLVVEITPDT